MKPSLTVLVPVANMGLKPEYIVIKVLINDPESGTLRMAATTGDIKTPAPPGIPGDSRPRIHRGMTDIASWAGERGMSSKRVTDTVQSMTPMVEALLLRIVPKTMAISAIRGERRKSFSAESTLTAKVS